MARRSFSDRRGGDWTVTDIRRSTPSEPPFEPWLCFVGPDGSRVRLPLAKVDGDWKRLMPADLAILLDNAIQLSGTTEG